MLHKIDKDRFVATAGAEYYDVITKRIGDVMVKVDPQYFRPTEVELLIGDNTKAKTKLGWEPEYSLAQLCKDMVSSDLQLMKKKNIFVKEDIIYSTILNDDSKGF